VISAAGADAPAVLTGDNMRIAGIISEFNPFHKGHRYLIDTVRRELKPDGIISVMSGNFVQRGEPAMWDKWIRAACAVENGVDLVLELPVCYAVNSGEEFARGGIGILQGTGIVTDLAFGSESGLGNDLESAAGSLVEENEVFSATLKASLRQGVSYPVAYERAAGTHPELQLPERKRMLRMSNDILALEYIKQMRRMEASFAIFPIKRIGPGHDEEGTRMGYASASTIRQSISEGLPAEDWTHYLPAPTAKLLADIQPFNSEDRDRHAALLRYVLQVRSSRDLSSLISVGEGLENRMKQAVIKNRSVEEIIMHIKTKRYTYARIARILIQALLDLDKDRYGRIREDHAFYGRVLAFSPKGAQLLRRMRKGPAHMPVYTNLKQADCVEESIRDSLAWDALAADVYSIIRGTEIYYGSDKVKKPYMSKGETEILCTSAPVGV
jgi:predicted nucleotidyltransferase